MDEQQQDIHYLTKFTGSSYTATEKIAGGNGSQFTRKTKMFTCHLCSAHSITTHRSSGNSCTQPQLQTEEKQSTLANSTLIFVGWEVDQ